MMNWDDLRFFVDLAETASLSATARNLRVDHSTVARRIAALEQSLGLRLFDRLPQGYPLTAEGERLKEQTAHLSETMLAIARSAAGGQAGLSGTVRVSAPPAFAAFFLAARLGPLRAAHPGIQLELSGSFSAANLTRRDADIAIRLRRPEGAALVARRLCDSGYGLFAARDSFAGTPIDTVPLMGFEENLNQTPQQVWLRRYAGKRPFVLRTSDHAALYQAVRAGLGAATLPFFLTAGDKGLMRLDRNDMPKREVWLLAHEDVSRAPRVRAVMEGLADIIRRDRAIIETDLRPLPALA